MKNKNSSWNCSERMQFRIYYIRWHGHFSTKTKYNRFVAIIICTEVYCFSSIFWGSVIESMYRWMIIDRQFPFNSLHLKEKKLSIHLKIGLTDFDWIWYCGIFTFNRQVGSTDGSLWTLRLAFYAIFCPQIIGHHHHHRRQIILLRKRKAFQVIIEALILIRWAQAVFLMPIAQRTAAHLDGRLVKHNIYNMYAQCTANIYVTFFRHFNVK